MRMQSLYPARMSARLLTGKEPAEAVLSSVKADVLKLDPKLVIVQVGRDPASDSYIRKKMESSASVGMRAEHHRFDDAVTFEELMAEIKTLNADPDVTGFIIQLPLPKHLEEKQPQLFKAIDPYKDVDGFTAYNLGKALLSTEFEHLLPATAVGTIELLNFYKIDIPSKNIVVVGQSNIVGKPLSVMLMNRGATVTMCHEGTKDLAHFTKQADILISATGKNSLVTADMIKDGAVLIDIGMSRHADGHMSGDMDYPNLLEKASAITPVPGGIGPMTGAFPIRNCVTAKKRQLAR